MKRQKRAKKGTIRKLTKENAGRILKRYAKRSCRGGVSISFDITPGAIVPEKVALHCVADKYGRPECIMMSTKGKIIDGSIEGYALRIWTGEDLETIHFPIAAVRGSVSVEWHEWAENTQL